MKLTASALKYEHVGEDGYSFTVEATQEASGGWRASVTMETDGSVSAEHAIKHLRYSAEAFLRALAEMAGT